MRKWYFVYEFLDQSVERGMGQMRISDSGHRIFGGIDAFTKIKEIELKAKNEKEAILEAKDIWENIPKKTHSFPKYSKDIFFPRRPIIHCEFSLEE